MNVKQMRWRATEEGIILTLGFHTHIHEHTHKYIHMHDTHTCTHTCSHTIQKEQHPQAVGEVINPTFAWLTGLLLVCCDIIYSVKETLTSKAS